MGSFCNVLIFGFAALLAVAPVASSGIVAVAPTAHVNCSNALATTLSFNAEACPSGVNFNDSSCWSPSRVPISTDVLYFPPASNVTMSPSSAGYAWLEVAGIVVAKTGRLTLTNGALVVKECLQVYGSLLLRSDYTWEESMYPAAPLPADPSVPQGTDCRLVGDGFAPRICGPGELYVAGTVEVMSAYSVGYASIWTSGVIAASGHLVLHDFSFWWGNITNYGRISSTGQLFFHGALTNAAGATASFNQLRADFWTPTGGSVSLYVTNEGDMAFTSECTSSWCTWDLLSTKDEFPVVTLVLLNRGTLLMTGHGIEYGAASYGGTAVRLLNLGTTVWNNAFQYWGSDSVINSGTMIANGTHVHLTDYLSNGGTLSTVNGGFFHFGPVAGVDTKTAVVCEKGARTQQDDKRKADQLLTRKPIVDVVLKTTNVSCDPSEWNSCPSPLCCGASGVCEEARCQNADGYGGGPFCCGDNAFCGGSSHGPYCGAGIFSWEVDNECLEVLEYVDRYEFEHMKTHFGDTVAAQLPKFGRYRYTFRGSSRIMGDGTGAVMFGEPMEVRVPLVVGPGGVLRCLMDNGGSPFVGHGSVRIAAGGRLFTGIRASLTPSTTAIVLEADSVMEIPTYGSLQLSMGASLLAKKGSALEVNGRLFVINGMNGQQRERTSAVKQCGELRGSGVVVEEVPLAGGSINC